MMCYHGQLSPQHSNRAFIGPSGFLTKGLVHAQFEAGHRMLGY